MKPLRIVFAGSPAAAVPSLRTLFAGPHEVEAVVTREDAAQGRKRIMTPTPVALEAEAMGIPVVRANLLLPVSDDLIAFAPDLGVVVAYGGLIREPLLSAPRLGWINLHFSLLPRWRGAAPVQRAVMAGDTETGAAVFQLVEELDAGPVYAMEHHRIGAHQTAGHLLEQLSESGAALLARVVNELAQGTASAREQVGEPTRAPKLTIADGEIVWSEDALIVDARIRGTTPEPGAFTLIEGERLKVHASAIAHGGAHLAPGQIEERAGRILTGTANQPIELLRVQPAGRREMSAADWWRGRNGAPVSAG